MTQWLLVVILNKQISYRDFSTQNECLKTAKFIEINEPTAKLQCEKVSVEVF